MKLASTTLAESNNQEYSFGSPKRMHNMLTTAIIVLGYDPESRIVPLKTNTSLQVSSKSYTTSTSLLQEQ
jgi:hypothetical protein